MDDMYQFQDQNQSQLLEQKIQYAHEFINQANKLNEQRTGLELFQAHLLKTKITYLDQHKMFAVVKVSYLEELEKLGQQLSQRMKEIEQKSGKQIQQQSMLRAIVKITNERVVELQQKLKTSEYENKKLLTIIEGFNKKLEESRKIKYQSNIQSQILQIKLQQAKQEYLKSKISLEQISVQTQYIPNPQNQIQISENVVPFANEMARQMRTHNRQIQNVSHMAVEGSDDSIDEEEELAKLKNNFEYMLEEVTKTFNEKIEKLKQQNLQIREWQQENERVKKENEELKKQLRVINEKEEKITIWKTMMNDFINKVDEEVDLDRNNMAAPCEDIEGQNNRTDDLKSFAYEEKIRILEDQVLRFQAQKLEREEKLKELQQIMASEQEMPEQNIINNLIVMSSKVKACVQFLLQKCA